MAKRTGKENFIAKVGMTPGTQKLLMIEYVRQSLKDK